MLTLEESLSTLQERVKNTPLSVAEILQILSGKGRSLILILLSLPFCQPIQIPGLSTPFGIIIAFFGLRIAFGKRIWLPKKLLAKTIPAHTLEKIISKTLFLVRKVKFLIHPRLAWMCHSFVMEKINGLAICILGILLAAPLPIPFSNLAAAWSILLIALGILEDDGVIVVIGYMTTLITLAFFLLLAVTVKKRILTAILSPFALAHAHFHSVPHAIIPNTASTYSLLNSIDFHPHELLFCVTHMQNNQMRLYNIDHRMRPILVQTIEGSHTRLNHPQHAVFSPDGQSLVAANWTDRSFNVYVRKNTGLFEEEPIHTFFLPKVLKRTKPHGIAFSSSGQYLAVACGAGSDYKNGLALFESTGDRFKPVDILTHKQLLGMPKGICFSPDGTCLLVSFCKPSCIAIFSIDRGKIDRQPKQIMEGAHTHLSRPEDIKLSPDGSYCAVSNSDKNTITFYHFDKNTNTIANTRPFWSLGNPEAHFTFPHGLAFSPEGSFLATTQFGHVEETSKGSIFWSPILPSQEGAVHLYLKKEEK